MLKVWGLDGSNPVTLVGHQGAIFNACIVSRGKNILSCSRDGSVKLWETASGSLLHTWSPGAGSVNTIAIGSNLLPAKSSASVPLDPREIDTQGQILLVGTESGKLFVIS